MIYSEVRGLAESKRKMEQVIADLKGPEVLDAFRDATVQIANTSKRLAPVNTGRLRSSIAQEVRMRDNVVEGVVGSNVRYAPYMELGTGTFVGKPRHYPPAGALDVWARRNGMGSGYVVAQAIGRAGGLKPRRFMQRAFEQHRDTAVDKISQAVQLIVNK